MPSCSPFFFFNDTATTEIYTLSLHDALPISQIHPRPKAVGCKLMLDGPRTAGQRLDRKSTRLNSSHPSISYAVFCLKKKKTESYHRCFVQWNCRLDHPQGRFLPPLSCSPTRV